MQHVTVESADFYNELVNGIAPDDSILSEDEANKTIELNVAKVEDIQIENVSLTPNDKQAFETLISGCTGLKKLTMISCDEINLSGLNNNSNFTSLSLYRCGIKSVPDLSAIPNLSTLNLSRNSLSIESIKNNLTNEKLKNLTALYLDLCGISDVGFVEKLDDLTTLSLADNSLTDASVETLIGMKGKLTKLRFLYFGGTAHTGKGGENLYLPNGNKFTDLDKLASFPAEFPSLTSLDLSELEITSLEKFKNVRTDINIDFTQNNITDFTGYKSNFKVEKQEISLTEFPKGWACELPEDIANLIERVLTEDDELKGILRCDEKCILSEDNKWITVNGKDGNDKDVTEATVEIRSGKLSGTKITLKDLIKVPEYLTAAAGSTLESVELPEDFEWKDLGQGVGAADDKTFQAVYTIQKAQGEDESKTMIVEVPVRVTGSTVVVSGTPTLSPVTSAPVTPPPASPTNAPSTKIPETQTPATPSPSASSPVTPAPVTTSSVSPAPETPAPSPEVPTQTPEAPGPDAPTQTPEAPGPDAPTAAPEVPTPTPVTPTQTPDESNQTGNQIEKRTDLLLLISKGKVNGNNGIRLTWNKWSGCSGYEVYWSYCDGKQNFKKIKTVKSMGKRTYTHNNLKKNRAYKYYIATYRIKDGRKNYLAKSPVIHVAMKHEKYTNAKSIKVNKANVSLKVKGTFQVKATVTAESNKKKLLAHDKKFRYYTDKKDVADITKKGLIKAKKKGSCTIYVIANNGVAKTVKVTVK